MKYAPQDYMDYRAFMKCIFQKSYASAIADFRSAMNMHGHIGVMDHSYDFYIGLCYLQLNQFDSARYYISYSINDRVKQNGEKWVNPLEWFYLGIVDFEQLDYNKAIASFDKSLLLYPECCDVKYYKAFCLDEMGKNKEALALMREAYYDFKQGYSINEDNAVYEAYPYQKTTPRHWDSIMKWMEDKNKPAAAAKE